MIDFISHDPIEDTPEYLAIKDELEEKIIARGGKRSGLGFCHLYWMEKKRILKEEYGIDWRSPAELNPSACFD